MRGSLLKGLALALVVAAVLAPAAAAKPHHAAPNLALVPLQKAQLGAAGTGLTITRSRSGPFTNGKAAAGYQLIYGSPYLANAGLDYAETSVNEYKTVRVAKRDFVTEKKLTLNLLQGFAGLFSQLNVTESAVPLAVPGIRRTHWAVLETFTVAGHGSVYAVAVDFHDGKYVLESAAAAGSQSLAVSYAAARARALDKRLHLWLKGRLHARPVALPKPSKPGPPASGTDPATAVLQTSDLPGSTLIAPGYSYAEAALSSYDVSFQPGGSFDSVLQTVSLMPSASSAAFAASVKGATTVGFATGFSGGTVTPVDVSAAGDDAQAAIVSASASSTAVITLDSGAVADIVTAQSATTIDASAVQALAQAAATRLNAALGP